MPTEGDTSRSDLVGLNWKHPGAVYWTNCPECGEGRWVRKRSVGRMCKPCNLKVNVQPKGCAARLKGKGHLQAGENNPTWKGGVKQHTGGYRYALINKHDPMWPMVKSLNRGDTGYVLEHRLVVARALGRPLTDQETVHHRNGDRQDNRIENLELWFGNHGNGQRAHEYHCPGCRCFDKETQNEK